MIENFNIGMLGSAKKVTVSNEDTFILTTGKR